MKSSWKLTITPQPDSSKGFVVRFESPAGDNFQAVDEARRALNALVSHPRSIRLVRKNWNGSDGH